MEWKTTHKKSKAVEDFPITTTQITVRQSRSYIIGMLRGLLKTIECSTCHINITDQWTPECQDAFDALKAETC